LVVVKVEVVPEGVHAIFAVDPGGTTGVFAGWVELKGTTRATVTEGLLRSGAVEVGGPWLDQAQELSALFGRFDFHANNGGIPVERRHLVMEDFVLRRRVEGGATGNLTSVWVAAAFTALVNDLADVEWQQASDAKTYASDERLKRWALWIKGSAHKRDAARHFALKTTKLLSSA
jgi:hypothetical protein